MTALPLPLAGELVGWLVYYAGGVMFISAERGETAANLAAQSVRGVIVPVVAGAR